MNRIDDFLMLEDACFECDRILRRNLLGLLRSPSACCLGAFLRGQLIGSMVLLFRRNTRVVRIYSVAVASSHRGQGIARKLLVRAEREARSRGCNRIRLEVRLDNMPAIRLYESLGFEDKQVLPGYYADGTHAMVYWKQLD
jgi:ribosomal protein S18 acetylase RimI-like enzyme